MYLKSLKRVFGILVVFSLLAILSVPVFAGDIVTIRYSDHDAPGGMRPRFIKDVWMPEVIKQTGGKVQFEDFWGGALLSSQEVLAGIGSGVTDMGYIYVGHYPSRLVSFTAFKLFPKGPKNFDTMAWFFKKAFEEIPELTHELEKANVKPLLVTAGLPGAFCCKEPIIKITDVSGEKWRAADKWAFKLLENMGAVPVSVAWDDVYMALQTGTLTGCFSNYDAVHMAKLFEPAPNLLVSQELWFGLPFPVLVNIDFWNKLPEDIQRGITKASEIASEKFAEVYRNEFNKTVEAQREAGCTVTFLSAEDVDLWASGSMALQDQWIKEAEEAGLETASSVIEKMRQLVDQAIKMER